MKNMKRIILVVAIAFGCSMSSFAQSGFSARISSNILLRTVAFLFLHSDKDDTTTNHGVNSSDDDINWGFWLAPLRFNLGVKYQYTLVNHLDVFAATDFFYTSLKGKEPDFSEELGKDEVLPASVNIPLVLGLNYAFYKTTDLSLWGEVGVGTNFRRVTSKELVQNGSNVPRIVTSHHLGVTPTWKVGVGAIFDEDFSVELQYYSFGSSQVRRGAAGGAIGDWAHKFAGGFKTLSWDNSALFLCLGFHF